MTDLDDAFEILENMVSQHCQSAVGLDSMMISTNAEAMRFLAKHGRMTLTEDNGRHVRGFLTWRYD